MAEFVGKDLGEGTRDVKEYDRYCHFVAGLVGEGEEGGGCGAQATRH